MRVARVAWVALATVALALASLALARWAGALVSGAPVLYGEGAVAHAGQLLARGLDPYRPETPGTFVAANYPPVAFLISGLTTGLGPFLGLRAASILATLGLATLVAWRARRSRLAALTLGAAFLALFPVQAWGPAHKPDPLAVGLTAAAVVLAGPGWPRAAAAGGAGALAILAKPTAALPLVAVTLYLLWRERAAGVRVLASLAISFAALAAVSLLFFDAAGLAEHIVRRNALPYVPANALLVIVVGALTMAAFVALAATSADGRARAYLLGGAAVVLLAGREGATINYLLDLAAAACLAIASSVRVDRALPAALLALQLLLGAALSLSGAFGTTGMWTDPRRVALADDLPHTAAHLVEDSGVLIANGIEPEVDDLFLWARLVALGVIVDDVTPRVREGAFASVVSEVRLEGLDREPNYERQRWPPQLVRQVLGGYRLERGVPGHYRYVPRRGVALE